MAQNLGTYNAIYPGVPWFDNHSNVVSAHGGCITRDNGKYYLFGEKHMDSSNAFAGFNCYSSTDLYNWKFESLALGIQDTGRLGPNRVGERVKVLKCPKTGEYIMLMHADDMAYKDQYTGYATAETITGPYTFRGALLFNGKPIRKWDIGAFQDTDGSGYLLTHGGDIYKLADDYQSVTEQVAKNISPECESPAMFKKAGIYYWLGSHRTSWERNDNFYYTAASLKGPWTARGNFAPVGTLTWNSQTTFVLPVAGTRDTTYLFMGDRWSYPLQASSATYVWQPLKVSGTSVSIPKYFEAWQIDQLTGVMSITGITKKMISTEGNKAITYSGQWRHSTSADTSINISDAKGASFSIKYKCTQIGFYSEVGPNGGYARVTLQNSRGGTILTSIVDMYALYPASTLKFVSPLLPKDNYTLTVAVMGEHSSWSDKRRSDYGSKGDVVSIGSIIVK
ncbi:family 43 glycosylhydrolase [Mucilaginibacter sp. AW1-3]